MNKGSITLLMVLLMSAASIAYGGDWNLVKNVRRLEQVAPDYKEDKPIDKKFLEVLDLTEKTSKDADVYEEAKKIANMPALKQSKYMDSFLYYMLVRSISLAKNSTAEPDYWLVQIKPYDKSPHVLAAWLVHMKLLPKNSPELRRDAHYLVDWVKAQKPDMKVRAPEYAGNMLMGYKPRSDFAEGDHLKLYALSYYKSAVTPPAGFSDDDTYVTQLDRVKDGREDIMSEMSGIFRKMGKRKEASDMLYQLATLKVKAKDFQNAKALLDDAVKLNPENAEAMKERNRIKLELTYQSLSPAVPPAPAAPAAAAAPATPAAPVPQANPEGQGSAPGHPGA